MAQRRRFEEIFVEDDTAISNLRTVNVEQDEDETQRMRQIRNYRDRNAIRKLRKAQENLKPPDDILKITQIDGIIELLEFHPRPSHMKLTEYDIILIESILREEEEKSDYTVDDFGAQIPDPVGEVIMQTDPQDKIQNFKDLGALELLKEFAKTLDLADDEKIMQVYYIKRLLKGKPHSFKATLDDADIELIESLFKKAPQDSNDNRDLVIANSSKYFEVDHGKKVGKRFPYFYNAFLIYDSTTKKHCRNTETVSQPSYRDQLQSI